MDHGKCHTMLSNMGSINLDGKKVDYDHIHTGFFARKVKRQ
jgi:hypothetical protein